MAPPLRQKTPQQIRGRGVVSGVPAPFQQLQGFPQMLPPPFGVGASQSFRNSTPVPRLAFAQVPFPNQSQRPKTVPSRGAQNPRSFTNQYQAQSQPSPSAASSTRIVITNEMEEEILELNNEYIRKQDPEFRYIMEKACQAAIYCYKLGEGEGWGDAKAAGSLMLYERNVAPKHGFIIFNRLAVPNWKHTFTPKLLEIQIQGKYLLFKDGSEIFSLWFYRDKDPEKFGEILKRLGCTVV